MALECGRFHNEPSIRRAVYDHTAPEDYPATVLDTLRAKLEGSRPGLWSSWSDADRESFRCEVFRIHLARQRRAARKTREARSPRFLPPAMGPWSSTASQSVVRRSCTAGRGSWLAQVDPYAPPPSKWRCQVVRHTGRRANQGYFRTWRKQDEAMADCSQALEALCSHRKVDFSPYIRSLRGLGDGRGTR